MADTYTHGHHESVLRSHTWRTVENSAAYLMTTLQPGLSLLDVGCGPGTITHGLAKELVKDRSQGVQLATLKELVRYWSTDSTGEKLRPG